MTTRTLAVATLLLVATVLRAPAQTTQPLTEDQKIERLIRSIAELKDATFIRNGDEHTAAAAADHLRTKWQRGKKHAKTAEDFIENIASKSSMSGKPYTIRFKDGKEVESGTFLREQLKKLNG